MSAPATRSSFPRQPRALLKSLTNHVVVTLYYDKQDALYGAVGDLLNEYSLRESAHLGADR